MRFSVLDQSPIPEGSTGADALWNTLDLALLADGLGYHRYWVAEHHGGPMLASASPEALIGPIASATERIRIGSGGVMLPHYSPFKVAQFSPERELSAPVTAVACWVLCAESDEEAARLAASSRMTLTLLRRGQLIPVPTPERALEFLAAEGKPVNGPLPGRRGIVGSPDTVRAGLERIAADYGADEVIVVTITHDHGARRRSYELLAEAVGLERQLTPAGRPAL